MHWQIKRIPRLLATIVIISISSSISAANVPILCEKASLPESYNNDFLDNFLTLKDGENGWLFRDTDLLTTFGPGKNGFKRLRYLAKLLRLHGTQLLVVPIPTRGISQPAKLGDIDYDYSAGRRAYREYLDELNRVGIVAPSLNEIYEGIKEETLFFARDHHWTSDGARKTAEIVAQKIKELPYYIDLEKKAFLTSKNKENVIAGSHQKAAQDICGSQYDTEKFFGYETYLQGDVVDALYAEDSIPDVVLVGTSNSSSRRNFNFVGFLKENTSLDILNYARSGGGYDKAILDYLGSDEFYSNPPRLLIWEYPSYYKLNSISFYKKMVRLLK